MSRVRLAGVAVALADAGFVWWGVTATAGDFGADYAAPSGRFAVLLIAVVIAVISAGLLIGPGRSVANDQRDEF